MERTAIAKTFFLILREREGSGMLCREIGSLSIM
jgi:hypothetical protein